MANYVDITVEDSDNLLNASMYGAGAIIRLQSGATETGAFANLATAPLVTATRIYTLYDTSGTSSTWYRLRYENAGGTTLSDWGAAFQVGDETAGQLCSKWDAKQRMGLESVTTEDENLIEFIRQVSTFIQSYTGRRFARSPSSGTTTFLFDIERLTDTLFIPEGIASMTALEAAAVSQPETGATYVTIPTTDWMLRPTVAKRDYGWPATSVVLDWRLATVMPYFYPGRNVVRATMALGFASVPYDIQAIALTLVVAAFRARGSSGSDTYTVGSDGSRTFENALPYRDRMTLDRYRVRAVG